MVAQRVPEFGRVDDLHDERARRSLRHFVRDAWHVVEPVTPFVPGFHLDAIADHLQAVTRGELRNLVINVPPRHSKSLQVSVFWPTWEWVTHPERRWLYSAYAASLSTRDSLKCRRLIESPWYQARWGDRYRLTSDQNAKTRYENDKTGYRIATSVGGAGTGEGGDVVVVDDPISALDAHSATVRQSTLVWWDETMSTRLNDPKTGAKVIVMQRLHENDLTGHVLAEGGYEHLCLPAEYEMTALVTGIGWADPRTEPGELLWPERFGRAEVEELKRTLGGQAAAGQLQQRPAPAEGGLFKRDWWRRYRVPPPLTRVETFVDSAFKEGVANDYSVFATWGTDGLGNAYLLDLWRDRVEFPALIRTGRDQHAAQSARFGRTVPLVVEDKASGQSALQVWGRPQPAVGGMLPALPVVPFRVASGSSKQARAEGATPAVEGGRVWLPEDAPWVGAFVEEHAAFPSGAHDDMVDTTSMMAARLLPIRRSTAWQFSRGAG